MRILLLGSEGFIAKHLISRLVSFHEIEMVSRNTDLRKLLESESIYDFVVNCASSKPTSDSVESRENNFKFPQVIFNSVVSAHWIQIESYFQLQIPMGRRDSYSIEKQRFSEYLDAQSARTRKPEIHHLFMPHVFGTADRDTRLISACISAIKNSKILETSSGSQFLPLLHVSDAVEGIAKFIENPSATASCQPFWYGKVKALLEILISEFQEFTILYGNQSEPVDASFPPVEFPESVRGWKPNMQLNEFLDWVKVQSEKS